MQEVEHDHGAPNGSSVTYQLELTLCGKPRCSKWHGPYWYAYWSEGGRKRKRYIGREFMTVTQKDRARKRAAA